MPVTATPLRDQISDATKDAMRAKNTLRVSTLRLVSAAVKDRDIAARSEDRCDGITDAEILSILSKMVKQREESGATCLKDMGKIMGKLKTDYAGRVDMGKAGAVVKSHLCS